jgi:hypothetical protein
MEILMAQLAYAAFAGPIPELGVFGSSDPTDTSLYGPPDPATNASLYGPPDPAANAGYDVWPSDVIFGTSSGIVRQTDGG